MTTFNFQAYRADVERKAAVAQREVENLFRDGKPVYMPDTHREQMTRVLAPLQQAVTEAEEYGQAAQAEAKKLEALQHGDPLSSLSNEELARLNLAKDLAAAEINALLPEQLAQRLTAVAMGSDRVSQMLHLLYARPLVQASGDSALHNKLAAIDAAVYGKERAAAAKAQEEAEVLRREAAQLSFYASDALAEVDGSNAQAFENKRAEYASYF